MPRVAPQLSCFETSTPGMPYRAERPRFLVVMSGAASVSAMEPGSAFVTSGVVEPWATPPQGMAARVVAKRAVVAVRAVRLTSGVVQAVAR